jgi:ribosomal protein S18 acetylase RimI-like enzyme
MAPTVDTNPALPSFQCIRYARCDDVEELVKLHLACFTPHEHMLIVFGESVLRPIYLWFVSSKETFTMVATSGGEIVGLCTACRRPYNWPMVRSNFFALTLGVLRHPQALFHPEVVARFRNIFSFLRCGNRNSRPLDISPPAQLGFLAVRQDYHGTLAGESLVRQTVEECQRRKWKWVRAGIYKKNLPARFMYAKLGFKENKALRTEQLVFVEVNLDDSTHEQTPAF